MLKNKVYMLLFLIIFAAVLALPSLAVSEVPDMSLAESVYFYNIEQKTVMAEKNANKIVYPASVTKVMTGLIAAEELGGRMNEGITVTEEMLKGVSGNNIKLKAGERVTIGDMLYAAVCGSANDACSVLAHLVSGTAEAFVEKMNLRATELGAIDTNYTNVSGMHNPNMVTTAYDTFLIAKAASENSLFVSLSSESKYEMPETNMSSARNIYNKNHMISRYSETKYYNKYAMGLNAGSTSQGGNCLATCTEKDGQTYICVVLGASETADGNIASYTVANSLINWAYSSYGYVEVLSKDLLVCEIDVALSEDVDYVTLRPAKEIVAFLPLEIDMEKELEYNHSVTSKELDAPVEEGQSAGFISVSYDGKVLGTVELVAMNKVDRSEFLYTLKKITDFTSSRPFIITAVTFALLFVVYVFLTAFYRTKPPHRRRRRK